MINLPSGYSRVDNYLIRGKRPSLRDLYELHEEGVNQIYDFRHYSPFGLKFIERGMCKLMGIKYNRVAYSNLYGDYPSLDTFEKISTDVHENGKAGGITLFHCNSGRHRTSHFSAFYALTQGKPLSEIRTINYRTYDFRREKIIQEQIIDRDYFNRKRKNYVGRNPLKQIYYRYNDRICDGIQNAHKKFLNMIKGK